MIIDAEHEAMVRRARDDLARWEQDLRNDHLALDQAKRDLEYAQDRFNASQKTVLQRRSALRGYDELVLKGRG